MPSCILSRCVAGPVSPLASLDDKGADVQGAYPVFQQTDVKRAFDVACAAFQGRFLRNGESVLVRDGVLVCSAAFLESRGPCMAPNCCLAGSVA